MTDPQNNLENTSFPEFKDDLAQLYRPPTPFPTSRDTAILAAVRQRHQEGVRGSGRWWRYAIPAGIAAAVTVAAIILWNPAGPQAAHSPMASGGGGMAETLAGYQKTGDIRDAYYVARQLRMQKALEARWDMNHDGVVNEGDVQALAMAAVKLDKGER